MIVIRRQGLVALNDPMPGLSRGNLPDMSPGAERSMRKGRCHSREVRVSAIDLFCGAGGLTRGLLDARVPVLAGYDIDPACRYPYERNNDGAIFIQRSVSDISIDELSAIYPKNHVRVLVGCAPCQPFSRYSQKTGGKSKSDQWGLLGEFGRIVSELRPEIVSMENVPEVQRHSVFSNFVSLLRANGYHVAHCEVYCPDYGIPQQRKRVVLLASLLGQIELIDPGFNGEIASVRTAIAHLQQLDAGEQSLLDPLHRSCRLSELNLKRIKASRPGGTWRDWPIQLRAKCHIEKSGYTYPSVYGRMEWDRPSPTITTQFYGFGTGRFGHPDQDRAITLREGAILQSFPEGYEFLPQGATVQFSVLGRMIGNAVPVKLGEAIGESILNHISSLSGEVINA